MYTYIVILQNYIKIKLNNRWKFQQIASANVNQNTIFSSLLDKLDFVLQASF